MARISLSKIAHPIRMIFLSLVLLSFASTDVNAQSEGWAAGELTLEYVSGTCLNPAPGNEPKYNVILRFYRDDYGVTAPPWEATRNVMVYSQEALGLNFANAIPHQLSLVAGSDSSVNQYCLNGNPVATEGATYRSTTPITLWPNDPARTNGPWFFYYVGQFDGNYRSPEDRNIQLGQKFFIQTQFDLQKSCGFVSGNRFDPVSQTWVPTTVNNEAPNIQPTKFVFGDPVASFCVGKEYEWQMKGIPQGGVERIGYGANNNFGPILRNVGDPAIYLTSEGFGFQNPFPTARGIDKSNLNRDGILRFTPSEPFAGPVPFDIQHFVSYWQPVDGDPNQALEQVQRNVLTTRREYRFIFDVDCNFRLPQFVGGTFAPPAPNAAPEFNSTFNPNVGTQGGAAVYNCATTSLFFKLSEPVLVESLGDQSGNSDQGFRLGSIGVGGSPNNPFLDDVPIKRVRNRNVININETDIIEIELDSVVTTTGELAFYGIGPGEYFLYMKKGDDLNTLVNRCEATIPENDTLAFIYVNDNYVYDHPFESYSYCFPTGKAPTAVINIPNADYTTWKYYGETRFFPPGPFDQSGDDTTFADTVWQGPKRFTVDHPEDSDWVNSKINIGAGWWRVGVGIDYSTYDPQTGAVIERRICYDEDDFYVDTVTVEAFEIPDFDLCPREDYPVIDLSAYQNDIVSSSFDWGKWNYPELDTFVSQTSPLNYFKNPPIKIPDSVGRDYVTVSTTPYVFDTDGPAGGVGDTNFFRAKFSMRGKYIPTKTCPVQIEFKVLKQLVEVELNEPADSVICAGEQYRLWNTKTQNYFKPEQYSFQWYLNQTPLNGETSDTLMITTTGMYTLEVTKTTDASSCVEYDSVYVRISDFLDPVTPGCVEITFNDGEIEQLFTWNTTPNAERYQVRRYIAPEYTADGIPFYGAWEDANGDFGIFHRTTGAQVGLEVRALNGGVDDAAICRYSDTTYAEPCVAVVKPTNVFTPNGDGINDLLRFDLVEVFPGSALQIFNRWGELIYSTDDYKNDWDGENFKEGTYFYILDINDPRQELMKGTFTIIRD